MTTLALQNEGMDLPQFVFLNNIYKNNSPKDSVPFTRTTKKAHTSAMKGKHEKSIHANPNFNNNQLKAPIQASKHHHSDRKAPVKPNHIHMLERFETQHHNTKSAKGNGLKNAMDKPYNLYYASTASSESDDSSSSGSEAFPGLKGFKVVHGGNVLHDQTREEFESLFTWTVTEDFGEGKGRFASSTLVTGPSNNISLPTFV
jgi:hypothetical protein